jgi:hypothetical protein
MVTRVDAQRITADSGLKLESHSDTVRAPDLWPDTGYVLIQEDGVLDGADVLPGFLVMLRDVLP